MRLSIASNFLPKSHVVDEPILVLLNLFGGSQSFWKKNGSLAPFLTLDTHSFCGAGVYHFDQPLLSGHF